MAGRVAGWIERSWRSASPAARLVQAALQPAALAYGVGVAWRNRRYDRGAVAVERVPARVIGVGNLTVGGTGKTPTALWLAEGLAARGRRPAIVARGYGKRRSGVVVVSRGDGAEVSARDGGDEAVMLAQRFRGPIVTAERRADAACAAIAQFGADVIVLDDGFQHRRLHRDADLLLLPPLGVVERLLPAGPFREGWPSVRRATALLAVGACAAPPETYGRPVFHATVEPTALVRVAGGRWEDEPLAALAGVAVVAVAGVARPERLATALRAAGVTVAAMLAFPDHHDYGDDDVARILATAAGRPVVCTEKDLVKLADRAPWPRLLALRIALRPTDGDRLLDLLAGTGPVVDFTGECR